MKDSQKRNRNRNQNRIRRRKRNKIVFIGLLLAVILFGCLGWLGLRLRGGVQATPSQDIAGAATVSYQQDDPRWAQERLGNSDFTMASSGCLVTCITSALQMETAVQEEADSRWEDPGALNRCLTENQVYDNRGNLQWEPLNRLEGLRADVCDDKSSKLLEEYLQRGHYPIVRVRMSGLGNVHYVLVVGAKAGEFICMDPLNPTGEAVPLSDFGNRIYAIRCVYPQS